MSETGKSGAQTMSTEGDEGERKERIQAQDREADGTLLPAPPAPPGQSPGVGVTYDAPITSHALGADEPAASEMEGADAASRDGPE